MDSKVTGNRRPTTERNWVIGGGIEIPCRYRLYKPKSVKKEVLVALKLLSEFICNHFYEFFRYIQLNPKNIMIQNMCVVNFYFLFTSIAGFSEYKPMGLFFRGDLYSG